MDTFRVLSVAPSESSQLQQALFLHFGFLIAGGDVRKDSPLVLRRLEQVRDVEFDDAVAGLLESGTPCDCCQGVEWTQCHVASRHRHELADAVLAIEVGDRAEPFDEADVVRESLTSLGSADDERWRIEACQRLRLRSQRESA